MEGIDPMTEEGRVVIKVKVLKSRFVFRKKFPFVFYYQLITFRVCTDKGPEDWMAWLGKGDTMEVRDGLEN